MDVWTFVKEVVGIYWLIFNSLLCIVIYQYVFKNWNYFTKRNVKFIRGLPPLGTQYTTLLGRESILDAFQRFYEQFPNEKFFGIYEIGGQPKYVIRDLEMIKQITIKDFDHFINHGFDIHEDSDPMLGRSLFMMKDQRWKDMRSTLSPAFTGSKMRLMFGLITEVSNTFCDYLKTCSDGPEYDAKDLTTKFANDAIASCAFGLNINTMKDKDNDFYKIGQSVSNFEGFATFKFFAYVAIPKIMNFFKIPVFKAEDANYFRQIILDNISYREKNNIVRNDMINILIETKKEMLTAASKDQDTDAGFVTIKDSSDRNLGNKVTKWTDDDLVAQSMIFFLAGFGTVSLSISFVMHALVVNPDVQEKLYQEILEVQKKLDGKPLSYEALQKMKYMDMVFNETMRKWPQSPANDRVVNKPYVLDDGHGNKVELNVGDMIWIPVSGVHMDPKYFPNPEKFDPERFNDENKDKIPAGSYMPFGIGPRNCIASRFATMECKAFLFHLVANFHLDRCSRTQDPLKLKANSVNIEGENGFWMKLRNRV